MKTCVYCGSSESLVAEMTLSLDDGSKASVSICAVHADDATLKTAKQKYVERQKEIDDLLEKAKALGLTLSQERSPSGLLLVQSTKKEERPRQTGAVAVVDNDPEMIDTDIVERRDRGMISRGGSVDNHAVESHQSINLAGIKQMIGEETLHGKVKMKLVERQGGSPVAIPEKRVDGLGTTRIIVAQITDNDLQRRFKNMAEESKTQHGWERMQHLGRDGFNFTTCPICRGDGTARNAGVEIVCPKCTGRGIIG